ncbi:putative SWI2/SNF2 Brahma-like [Besnoitia besnoiti]|uniref:Putative SWI2/SNF2 Brahma-like n=1 Tax=Besnoitia besnoiti TaxID=94643 RepID=A0A2A9MDT2_BESBE|nr:putative SWI2/SNF2 Brahma-like [Besnoitia besnoiti]PFH36155.1 putative SWI2/SNF2 Brahma-like [Besnoitia besnoiti]
MDDDGAGPMAPEPTPPQLDAPGPVADSHSVRDFLQAQRAFFAHTHTHAEPPADLSAARGLGCAPSAARRRPPVARPLHLPPAGASAVPAPGKENALTVSGLEDSFQRVFEQAAPSAAPGVEDAEAEALSSAEIREQLRLQLVAARYVQQGAVPPAEILLRIHRALPEKEKRRWVADQDGAVKPVLAQLRQKIREGSRQEAFAQLEERQRLLDGLLDGKQRDLYEQFCYMPESVRMQAALERRLHSLARYQERLREAVLAEGRQSLLPPGGSLLLRPQVPRSLHERAFLCLCACASCCRRQHPAASRLVNATAEAAHSPAGAAAQKQKATESATLPPSRERATCGCCGCCCYGFCGATGAFAPAEKKKGKRDEEEGRRGKLATRSAVAWPAASGCGLFEALGDGGESALSRGPAGQLQKLAIKARNRALSAVQQVYAAVHARPCPALQPPLRQQQQKRKLWHRAAAQVRSAELREEWREKRALGKRVVNATAAQVAAIRQKQQQLREKAQKERMRLLKENDMASYMKLVEDTKNARLRELLSATDAFLADLSVKVRAQQLATKDLTKEHQLSEDRRKMTDSLEEEGEAAAEKKGEGRAEAEKPEQTEKQKTEQGAGSWALGQDQYYAMSHQVREEVKQPSILIGGDLMPYQMAGLSWMLSLYNNDLHGILADEMGLGKTIQTIALLAYLKEFKNNPGPHLIIVPLSTLPNWTDEFRHWCPSLKIIALKGGRLERRELQRELRRGDFNVCITTFDLAMRERHGLSYPNWRHLVVDEGHRMKNSKSKFHICVSEFRATHRLLLTGTPLQNNLAELWSLLNFLLPKIFSCASDFEKWFSQPFEGKGMAVESHDAESAGSAFLNEEERLLIINRLHAVLRPFLLRRVKKDVLKDMPERKEYLVRISLSAWQKAVYKQIQEKGLRTVDHVGNVTKRGFQNTLMQLRKIANHPYLFVDEYLLNEDLIRVAGKFECLDRMLPKLLHFKHKVLIFSQMTQVLDLMAEYMHLRGYKYARLDGSVGLHERKERMAEFNNAEVETMIFMLSTRAGGLGLNLQAADTVILFDSDFNPHQDLQAMCRAHRLGQTKQVKVFRLVTISGVEEIILEKANRKLSIDQMVIQAGMFDNKSSAELREEKLRLLLLLRKGATGDTTATTPLQLNRILARTEEEQRWFDEYDCGLFKKKLEEMRLESDQDLESAAAAAEAAGAALAAAVEEAASGGGREDDEKEKDDEKPLVPRRADSFSSASGAEEDDEEAEEAEGDGEAAEGDGEAAEGDGAGDKPADTPAADLAAPREERDEAASARGADGAVVSEAKEDEEKKEAKREAVSEFLEATGRLIAAAELPAWIVEDEEEEVANAKSEEEDDDDSALGGRRKRRQRGCMSRVRYCDALSDAKYVKLIEKFENGELWEEGLEEAFVREIERQEQRRRKREMNKSADPPSGPSGAPLSPAAGGGETSARAGRRGRKRRLRDDDDAFLSQGAEDPGGGSKRHTPAVSASGASPALAGAAPRPRGRPRKQPPVGPDGPLGPVGPAAAAGLGRGRRRRAAGAERESDEREEGDDERVEPRATAEGGGVRASVVRSRAGRSAAPASAGEEEEENEDEETEK